MDEEGRTRTPVTPWWQGKHGEWYVAAQFLVFAVVLFGPRTFPGLPDWHPALIWSGRIAGGLFALVGTYFILAGSLRLGRNITPVPYPKEHATLVESGPYRIVRHPIYSGGILAGLGWAFWVHGTLTILYVIIMFVFFDVKSRREEVWLVEKYGAYPEYKKRVRKLIPFIY